MTLTGVIESNKSLQRARAQRCNDRAAAAFSATPRGDPQAGDFPFVCWKILVHHSTCVQGVSNAAAPLSVLIRFTECCVFHSSRTDDVAVDITDCNVVKQASHLESWRL